MVLWRAPATYSSWCYCISAVGYDVILRDSGAVTLCHPIPAVTLDAVTVDSVSRIYIAFSCLSLLI